MPGRDVVVGGPEHMSLNRAGIRPSFGAGERQPVAGGERL